MNHFTFIVVLLIFSLISCEKDDFKREEIIGNWTLEKIQIDTISSGRLTGDSVMVYGNITYRINETDTLKIQYDTEVMFLMQFVPPDRIRYNSCPINFICIYSFPVEYRITRLSSSEMVWQKTVDYTEQRTLKETLSFSK